MSKHDVIREFVQSDLLSGGGDATLDYDEDLLLSGLLNSLGVMRLVAFLQDQFSVEIPPEDIIITNFTSINAIVDYLDGRAA